MCRCAHLLQGYQLNWTKETNHSHPHSSLSSHPLPTHTVPNITYTPISTPPTDHHPIKGHTHTHHTDTCTQTHTQILKTNHGTLKVKMTTPLTAPHGISRPPEVRVQGSTSERQWPERLPEVDRVTKVINLSLSRSPAHQWVWSMRESKKSALVIGTRRILTPPTLQTPPTLRQQLPPENCRLVRELGLVPFPVQNLNQTSRCSEVTPSAVEPRPSSHLVSLQSARGSPAGAVNLPPLSLHSPPLQVRSLK